LTSPRKTAPYQTLECSPSVTSPTTVADGATKPVCGSCGLAPSKLATARWRLSVSLKEYSPLSERPSLSSACDDCYIKGFRFHV
jgi:hypothetical protein